MDVSHHSVNAPGWSLDNDTTTRDNGPVCWKCLGNKTIKKKLPKAKKPKHLRTGKAPDATNQSTNQPTTQPTSQPSETAPAPSQPSEPKSSQPPPPPKPNNATDVSCPVCNGRGRLLSKKRYTDTKDRPGVVKQPKRPDGWVVPGPTARGGVEPVNGEERCALLGHWCIFQRVGGHRYSTDDVVTAWYAGKIIRASRAGAPPARCLDLGCGIGSVLMMVAWQFVDARCVGVEAQQLSASMARRSLQFNGCDERITVYQGDMRSIHEKEPALKGQTFQLVTGTPPYFPIKVSDTGLAKPEMGGMPSCMQSAPARYEFRGGVESYCAAAAKFLEKSEQSRFVVCEGWLENNTGRVFDGAKRAGLRVLSELKVHGRTGRPPLFAVYAMAWADCVPDTPLVSESITVRAIGGERTPEYLDLMRSMGIP